MLNRPICQSDRAPDLPDLRRAGPEFLLQFRQLCLEPMLKPGTALIEIAQRHLIDSNLIRIQAASLEMSGVRARAKAVLGLDFPALSVEILPDTEECSL